MKKQLEFLPLTFLCIILLAACTSEKIPEGIIDTRAYRIYIEGPDSLSFGANRNLSNSIIVGSDNTKWEITNIPNWLTVEPKSGNTTATVSLKAQEFNSDSPRLASFTIKSIEKDYPYKKEIIVMQHSSPLRTFTVTGNGKTVTFNMRLVEAVTPNNDFYMGETEVTQALWYAVTGQTPDSYGWQWNVEDGLGDNYPAYVLGYDRCQNFIIKLNQMTGVNFRLPTETEWEFAAKGGSESKGYTYAGSNILDDVGWYWSNAVDRSTHIVKTKAANEIGLYDMSGNVWEVCSGPAYRGGCFGSDEYRYSTSHRPSDQFFAASRENYIGCRLAL